MIATLGGWSHTKPRAMLLPTHFRGARIGCAPWMQSTLPTVFNLRINARWTANTIGEEHERVE
jgi:hypothetical protein